MTGITSSSPRSRIISSHPASRCLRLWAPLHATETMTCSRKALTYAYMRWRKGGMDAMARVKAARDILAAVPGIWTRRRAEDILAPNTACRPVQPSRPIVAISMVPPSE